MNHFLSSLFVKFIVTSGFVYTTLARVDVNIYLFYFNYGIIINLLLVLLSFKDDNNDVEPEIRTSEVPTVESIPDLNSILPPPIEDDSDENKIVEG